MTTNPVRNYFQGIWTASSTIFEGLVVTLSNFVRQPTTIQYPDRVPKPVVETLPPRYRGFVEVDPKICTGCKLCATACPIDCIHITVEKNEEKQRGMTAFAIDIGKCMFCGLCVEPCPTGAIRMAPNFEGAAEDLDYLVHRFVKPGEFVPVAKAKAALEAYTPPRGEMSDKARLHAERENPELRLALQVKLDEQAEAAMKNAEEKAAADETIEKE